MLKLYVTRHGETEWNKIKRLQGQGNSNLTQKGKNGAKCLHDRLLSQQIDCIVSSSLGRTRETTDIIKGNRDIKTVYIDDIMEMDVGDFSGHTRDEMNDKYPDETKSIIEDPINASYPNGENLQKFYDRCIKAVECTVKKYYSADKDISVLMIAHGGVVKCIESYFKGEMVPYNWYKCTPANCSLSLYEVYSSDINLDNVTDNSAEIFYDSRTHLSEELL